MPNANVEKIKASLLKEIKGVFCEGYCIYYKDDYYCGACPLNDTSNWLNRKKPIAREEKLRTVNFCDDCIHFRPLKEGEKTKAKQSVLRVCPSSQVQGREWIQWGRYRFLLARLQGLQKGRKRMPHVPSFSSIGRFR